METSHMLSRRQVLPVLAAPAALVTAGVSLAPLSAEPDTALRALYARWQAKSAEIEALPADYTDEAINALMDDLSVIERAIFAAPAGTLDALRIKAAVTDPCLDLHCGDDATMDDLALRAVFEAIRALAGEMPHV